MLHGDQCGCALRKEDAVENLLKTKSYHSDAFKSYFKKIEEVIAL